MNSLTNKFVKLALCLAVLLSTAHAAETVPSHPLKIRTVNFNKCVDNSKLGNKEKETFEAMKKQMESILQEKEKGINELAKKLDDADYLDSLTPEAETDLKRRYRNLSQEFGQIQNQYYQTLQQANVKIIDKLANNVAEASKKVAEKQNIDLIFNEESTFFHSEALDISDTVAKEMDLVFDNEEKETQEKK